LVKTAKDSAVPHTSECVQGGRSTRSELGVVDGRMARLNWLGLATLDNFRQRVCLLLVTALRLYIAYPTAHLASRHLRQAILPNLRPFWTYSAPVNQSEV